MYICICAHIVLLPLYTWTCVRSYIQLDLLLSLCAYSLGASLACSKGKVAMMLSNFFLKIYSRIYIYIYI